MSIPVVDVPVDPRVIEYGNTCFLKLTRINFLRADLRIHLEETYDLLTTSDIIKGFFDPAKNFVFNIIVQECINQNKLQLTSDQLVHLFTKNNNEYLNTLADIYSQNMYNTYKTQINDPKVLTEQICEIFHNNVSLITKMLST